MLQCNACLKTASDNLGGGSVNNYSCCIKPSQRKFSSVYLSRMDEPRAGAGRGHPLVERPQSLSARTPPARQVSLAPETPDCTTAPCTFTPGVGRVRRRHRTWEGSSTKLMVAEQKEIREREMMAEQMSRGRSSTSITGKLASLLVPSLYSRHSSDSGFHSRNRGEGVDEKMGESWGDVVLFVTDSRPPSLQVSRSASRAESVGSSIFSSDCLEVPFYSSLFKSNRFLRMSLSLASELFLVAMSQNPIGWEHFLARVPSLK